MPTTLVTGANRGLGLEFVKQYAAAGWRVHACCRAPESAAALQALKGDIVLHRLDVSDAAAIAALGRALAGTPVDVLLSNAGVAEPRRTPIAAMSDADWNGIYQINAVAPLRLAAALMESVAASAQKTMAFITSRMASFAHIQAGTLPYRMTKAALNAGVLTLSFDLMPRGIACLLLHPGWVRTDMGGPGAAIDAETSVEGMRAVIARQRPDGPARFFDYTGAELPW